LRNCFKYFEGTLDAVGIVMDSVIEYKTPALLDDIEPDPDRRRVSSTQPPPKAVLSLIDSRREQQHDVINRVVDLKAWGASEACWLIGS
jgi:hypothetical protein